MSVKTLQKTWSEIYQTFARLSALVTNAQANICCEDLCHQIHKHLKELDLPVSYFSKSLALKTDDFYIDIAIVCHIIYTLFCLYRYYKCNLKIRRLNLILLLL